MTQEEKDLLLKDLCARLPYKIKCQYTTTGCDPDTFEDTVEKLDDIIDFIEPDIYNVYLYNECTDVDIEDIKPYLRPMSSMTEEERKNISDRCGFSISGPISNECELIMPVLAADWLIDFYNERHIDYRGLIPIGLALEAKEGMYEKF